MSFLELANAVADKTSNLTETTAVGQAGTVYLCHPFLVHAAQPHHGENPRFLAQPPQKVPFDLNRNDGSYSLVEQSILLGLAGSK